MQPIDAEGGKMSDTVFVFVDTTQGANPPGGRRPGSPRRRGEPPLPGGSPQGLWQWMKGRMDRWICWAYTVLGTNLASITYWLSRQGLIGRRATFRLLRWTSALRARSVRRLRKASW
ncbi:MULTISPECIES: hypothetical protein [Brucella]|uniref:Uncharacterized protein n=1 Tax=Brucella suis (strain ATCC 23445 / NCTC 10510) TaxID=470137 RepID=A9WX66_BRUSI|nr:MULTISPECIES: hypothetical protein [Brucella]ABY39069.1 Hypothetical protein, conserved [Brucella suis ATCC 23445]QOK53862.1 hypothetical protein HUZ26_13285 [Brucella suis bv. 2]QOK71469.1 hypothetical protein HUZ32_13305 [Brucella suis bv. 2]QOK77240.1 hypothetical protein HUZ34_13295 [Brucella suis bv. 2]QOK80163.1 hypothetical protein HUZ35_13260 [Brucella suis bv. 2]